MNFCVHCGAQATPDAAFCTHCGKSLKETAPAPIPVATSPDTPATPQSSTRETTPKPHISNTSVPAAKKPVIAQKKGPDSLSLLFLTASIILILSLLLLPWFEFTTGSKYNAGTTYYYNLFGENHTLLEKEIGSTPVIFFIFLFASVFCAVAFHFKNKKGLSLLFSASLHAYLIFCIITIFTNSSGGEDSLSSGMIIGLIFSIVLPILSLISYLSKKPST